MSLRYVVGTIHKDYYFDRFSDDFYNQPDNTKGAYVHVAIDPFYLGYPGHEIDPKVLESLLSNPTDRYRLSQFFDENDTSLVYYVVSGGKKALKKYVKKLVKIMIERIPRLDNEDDHCDFYYSSLELLIQIAQGADCVDLLKPLHSALLKRKTCNYCDPDKCYVPELVGKYLS